MTGFEGGRSIRERDDVTQEQLLIRNMTRSEVDVLVSWAAREGWNPGLHDADAFWANDPEAFIAAELDGEMIGGGAITSYGGEFGFMGFFIVRPEFRGEGRGDVLWRARRDRLLGRLRPGAAIGMDGVFAMQAYYAKGGFVFSHRDIRFRLEGTAEAGAAAAAAGPVGELASGRAGGARSAEEAESSGQRIVPLRDVFARDPRMPSADISREDLLAYDRACFPASRRTFLGAWIRQPDSLALGCVRNGVLAGYGVVRRCREGCKIGPLFADDADAADALFTRLAPFAAGGPLFLDAPENNPAATALALRHGMTEAFGCARMYLGPAPRIAHERVFGVTTFELG